MNGLLLLVAAAATGVDVGWQPLAGGGYEYIIQIEPEALAAMQQGRDIVSDLPPQLRDIRRYRITIGTGPVPRIGTPPEMSDPGAIDGHQTAPGSGPRLPASPSGSDPFARDSGGGLRFADRNGGNSFPADVGTIGVSDPRLGAAIGLGAPPPSRLPSSDPYANDRNINNSNATDPRYNTNNPNNSGTNSNPANGSTGTLQGSTSNNTSGNNAPGTGYGTDPRNNLPTGMGSNDPFARDYTGNITGNYQDPRANTGTAANPQYGPVPAAGYPAGNNTQQGGNANWPANPQNAPQPGNTTVPQGYGNPMVPPANYNNPANQGNPTNYNPQPPYNNQPPANYNPPPAANNNQNNWPTNNLADNSRSGGESNTSSEVPKPFLETDALPRASFHSGAEGEKSGEAQWFPFTMALLMLFVSLGGNAYLGWIALTLRNKYMTLLEKLRKRMQI